jgi:hypothetical protein
MSSRANKESKLRHNVEASAERAYRSELKKMGKSEDPKLRERFRKEFEQSAIRIDKTKLHEVWND